MKKFIESVVCRSCKSSNLTDLFSLGDQYVTAFPPKGHEKDGILAPLDIMMCLDCKLVQLKHTVERDEMYREYWYVSGMNQTMRDALKDVADAGMALVNLHSGDSVIDIGSNDGTLLANYPDDVLKIGYEPARNIWEKSVGNLSGTNFKLYNDYFSHKGHTAKIITTIAMFYDLDDPDEFVRNIYASLDSDGIWINQQNYLLTMLNQNTFDNISHEHLCYYSLTSMEEILGRHNLQVIDVEENDINGGSFRAYITRKGSSVKPFIGASARIETMREREAKAGLGTLVPYAEFYQRICQARDSTRRFILDQRKVGKTFYLYGASTRGHVILQFYGLNKHLIKGAAERNPEKWGLVTIGTGIPIMSEEEVRNLHPDFMICLPYAFKREFVEREAEYIKNGGSLIFPLPVFEVVNKDSAYIMGPPVGYA